MSTSTTIPTKLTLVAERNAMARILIDAATERGWKVERDHTRDGCRSLTLKGERLAVLVHLEGRGGVDSPLLHWHGAKYRLQPLTAAWQSINRFHGHKATSYPMSLEQLVDMLKAGIEAANDCSAFLDGEE